MGRGVRLARRPAHGAAAKDVDVEMVYGLPAVRAGVYDEAIAPVEMVSAGDLACFGQKRAQQSGVGRKRVGVRGDVALRNDQDVCGGLGVDVREGEDLPRFMEAFGRDGARNDFAEKTVRRGLVRHVPYGIRRSVAGSYREGKYFGW